jgi:hypothetical protein
MLTKDNFSSSLSCNCGHRYNLPLISKGNYAHNTDEIIKSKPLQQWCLKNVLCTKYSFNSKCTIVTIAKNIHSDYVLLLQVLSQVLARERLYHTKDLQNEELLASENVQY